MILLRLIQAEFLKTKKIPLLVFLIILGLGSIGAFFFVFLGKPFDTFLQQNPSEENPNPWFSYYFNNYLLLFVIVLPFIVSITTYVVKNIEDRSDTWKRLFVLPYKRELLHLSKLCVVWFYSTFYVLITILLLLLSGIVLSKLKPDFNFADFPNYQKFLWIFLVKFELATVAITTFSYAYMVIIKRTVVSLLLSIFLPLVGLFFPSPYSSALHQFFDFSGKRFQMVINSEAYETLHLSLISQYDVVCSVVTVASLAVVVWASKKPIINYE